MGGEGHGGVAVKGMEGNRKGGRERGREGQ